jgi:CubicO group peptidase (beta-lactamase class C family)
VNLTVVEGGEIVRVEGDPDEQFQAGSISKPVAALTALRLGAVDLDADVNAQLRSWQLPDGDGVTPRQLLSHTAGLGVSFLPGYAEGEPQPTLVQTLDGAPPAVNEPARVEFPRGDGFHYSGGGYVLLQLLLEDLSGRPFAELARELVFEPLGMTSSTFEQVSGHRYPELAAAGLWTTTNDLARFVQALQADAAMTAAQDALPAEGE